jgi:hypothetical protein
MAHFEPHQVWEPLTGEERLFSEEIKSGDQRNMITEPVPGEKQTVLRVIPTGKGKHAIEAVEHRRPVMRAQIK